MSTTIRIDVEVFEALQKRAKPFVDSPNDVLRRLLGLNGANPEQASETLTAVNRPATTIDDPVMLIRLTHSYRPGMSGDELYRATRRAWKTGVRREKARFACTVFEGVVREVYEIHGWRKATPSRTDKKWIGDRWEFDGSPADEAVRSKYVGRRVASYFPRGFIGPIMYVNC